MALLLVALAFGGAVVTVSVRRAAPPDPGQLADRSNLESSGRPPLFWMVPEFTFVDQRGAQVTRALLDKHVWIADFIFTHCTSVCPMLTARMRLLQRDLANPSFRFISFSVDPENDTTDELRRYAALWAKDEARWLLLHTEPESLKRLTEGMRVVAEPTGNAANPILHTSLFFLVDAAGRVRGMYDSDDEGALQQLIADARQLSPGALAEHGGKDPVSAGKAYFDELGCGGCHDDERLGPSLHGIWDRDVWLAGSATARVTAPYVRESIVAPGAKLVAGYLNSMPSYARELSSNQLDALVDYVRSLSPAMPPTFGLAVSGAPRGVESAVPPAGVTSDPMCGMSVRVTPETPHVSRGGHEFYFCSDDCRARFLSAQSRSREPTTSSR